jgi:hypothetical protein
LKIQFILNQKKWVPHHMLFSLGIFLWWMMIESQILYCFKPCVALATILSVRLTILIITPKEGNVWFLTNSSMGLFLWKNIFWLNIQLLGTCGKVPMWLLI